MIGKLLGHRQVQTTARYAHLARESVKTSAARVAESIAADMEKRSPLRSHEAAVPSGTVPTGSRSTGRKTPTRKAANDGR